MKPSSPHKIFQLHLTYLLDFLRSDIWAPRSCEMEICFGWSWWKRMVSSARGCSSANSANTGNYFRWWVNEDVSWDRGSSKETENKKPDMDNNRLELMTEEAWRDPLWSILQMSFTSQANFIFGMFHQFTLGKSLKSYLMLCSESYGINRAKMNIQYSVWKYKSD